MYLEPISKWNLSSSYSKYLLVMISKHIQINCSFLKKGLESSNLHSIQLFQNFSIWVNMLCQDVAQNWGLSNSLSNFLSNYLSLRSSLAMRIFRTLNISVGSDTVYLFLITRNFTIFKTSTEYHSNGHVRCFYYLRRRHVFINLLNKCVISAFLV